LKLLEKTLTRLPALNEASGLKPISGGSGGDARRNTPRRINLRSWSCVVGEMLTRLAAASIEAAPHDRATGRNKKLRRHGIGASRSVCVGANQWFLPRDAL